eukprot:TRINITY_DN24854_c0_g1_i1.p1 TRINITY_DN24854_c0_g1~~TRINITY_DN24854_c0_g1_i1.p1  ORF type:complete len:2090 (+),score=633.98 TRINITY_DN24854_c0_g1_i1:64-6270(+)
MPPLSPNNQPGVLFYSDALGWSFGRLVGQGDVHGVVEVCQYVSDPADPSHTVLLPTARSEEVEWERVILMEQVQLYARGALEARPGAQGGGLALPRLLPEGSRDLLVLSALHDGVLLQAAAVAWAERQSMLTIGKNVKLYLTPPAYMNDPRNTRRALQGQAFAYGTSRVDAPEGPIDPELVALAEELYTKATTHGVNQTVCHAGIDGSGKRRQQDLLLRAVLATAEAKGGVTSAGTATSRVLKAGLALLDAFGSYEGLTAAREALRQPRGFGRFVKLFFNSQGALCGAKPHTYFLDPARVTQPTAGERSYDAFYQLLLHKEASRFFSLDPPDAYGYLASGVYNFPHVDDAAGFDASMKSMEALGMKPAVRWAVWGVLAGILHLSRVRFSASEGIVHPQRIKFVRLAAFCWGVNSGKLLQIFTTGAATTESPCVENAVKEEAVRSLCEEAYVRLFRWLVEQSVMLPDAADTARGTWIGLADFGEFLPSQGAEEQDPASDDVYSAVGMDSLQGNLCCELLQHYSLHSLFDAPDAQCVAAGVPPPKVKLARNTAMLTACTGGAPEGVDRAGDEASVPGLVSTANRSLVHFASCKYNASSTLHASAAPSAKSAVTEEAQDGTSFRGLINALDDLGAQRKPRFPEGAAAVDAAHETAEALQDAVPRGQKSFIAAYAGSDARAAAREEREERGDAVVNAFGLNDNKVDPYGTASPPPAMVLRHFASPVEYALRNPTAYTTPNPFHPTYFRPPATTGEGYAAGPTQDVFNGPVMVDAAPSLTRRRAFLQQFVEDAVVLFRGAKDQLLPKLFAPQWWDAPSAGADADPDPDPRDDSPPPQDGKPETLCEIFARISKKDGQADVRYARPLGGDVSKGQRLDDFPLPDEDAPGAAVPTTMPSPSPGRAEGLRMPSISVSPPRERSASAASPARSVSDRGDRSDGTSMYQGATPSHPARHEALWRHTPDPHYDITAVYPGVAHAQEAAALPKGLGAPRSQATVCVGRERTFPAHLQADDPVPWYLPKAPRRRGESPRFPPGHGKAFDADSSNLMVSQYAESLMDRGYQGTWRSSVVGSVVSGVVNNPRAHRGRQKAGLLDTNIDDATFDLDATAPVPDVPVPADVVLEPFTGAWPPPFVTTNAVVKRRRRVNYPPYMWGGWSRGDEDGTEAGSEAAADTDNDAHVLKQMQQRRQHGEVGGVQEAWADASSIAVDKRSAHPYTEFLALCERRAWTKDEMAILAAREHEGAEPGRTPSRPDTSRVDGSALLSESAHLGMPRRSRKPGMRAFPGLSHQPPPPPTHTEIVSEFHDVAAVFPRGVFGGVWDKMQAFIRHIDAESNVTFLTSVNPSPAVPTTIPGKAAEQPITRRLTQSQAPMLIPRFDGPSTNHQLLHAHALSALVARSCGFAEKMPRRAFAGKYRALVGAAVTGNHDSDSLALTSLLEPGQIQHTCESILHAAGMSREDRAQVGRCGWVGSTHVFLQDGVLEVLEDYRLHANERQAVVIQQFARAKLSQIEYGHAELRAAEETLRDVASKLTSRRAHVHTVPFDSIALDPAKRLSHEQSQQKQSLEHPTALEKDVLPGELSGARWGDAAPQVSTAHSRHQQEQETTRRLLEVTVASEWRDHQASYHDAQRDDAEAKLQRKKERDQKINAERVAKLRAQEQAAKQKREQIDALAEALASLHNHPTTLAHGAGAAGTPPSFGGVNIRKGIQRSPSPREVKAGLTFSDPRPQGVDVEDEPVGRPPCASPGAGQVEAELGRRARLLEEEIERRKVVEKRNHHHVDVIARSALAKEQAQQEKLEKFKLNEEKRRRGAAGRTRAAMVRKTQGVADKLHQVRQRRELMQMQEEQLARVRHRVAEEQREDVELWQKLMGSVKTRLSEVSRTKTVGTLQEVARIKQEAERKTHLIAQETVRENLKRDVEVEESLALEERVVDDAMKRDEDVRHLVRSVEATVLKQRERFVKNAFVDEALQRVRQEAQLVRSSRRLASNLLQTPATPSLPPRSDCAPSPEPTPAGAASPQPRKQPPKINADAYDRLLGSGGVKAGLLAAAAVHADPTHRIPVYYPTFKPSRWK